MIKKTARAIRLLKDRQAGKCTYADVMKELGCSYQQATQLAFKLGLTNPRISKPLEDWHIPYLSDYQSGRINGPVLGKMLALSDTVAHEFARRNGFGRDHSGRPRDHICLDTDEITNTLRRCDAGEITQAECIKTLFCRVRQLRAKQLHAPDPDYSFTTEEQVLIDLYVDGKISAKEVGRRLGKSHAAGDRLLSKAGVIRDCTQAARLKPMRLIRFYKNSTDAQALAAKIIQMAGNL